VLGEEEGCGVIEEKGNSEDNERREDDPGEIDGKRVPV